MNTRKHWVQDVSSQYISVENTIIDVKDDFNIRRYYSAEGKSVTIDDDIAVQVIIQSHSNPLNEGKYNKKIHIPIDTVVNTGSIVEWEDNKWIIVSNIDNLQAYKSASMIKCNNTLSFYSNENFISYEIPCIVIDRTNTNLQDNKYLFTIDCDILVMVANNEVNMQISSNDTFKIGRFNYYVTKPDDITKPGLILLPMKFSEVEQETHTFVVNILNGSEVSIQEGNTLQLNVQVSENNNILSPTPTVTYSSLNTSKANVSTTGLVTAVSTGICIITVSCNGVSDSITINVVEQEQHNYAYSLSSMSTPDTEIRVNQIKSYIAQKYNNGSPVVQTFTFSVTGESTSYQLVIVNGNECTIKALKANYTIILKAIDNNNDNIIEKNIILKSIF
jgi:hypothetical protein